MKRNELAIVLVANGIVADIDLLKGAVAELYECLDATSPEAAAIDQRYFA